MTDITDEILTLMSEELGSDPRGREKLCYWIDRMLSHGITFKLPLQLNADGLTWGQEELLQKANTKIRAITMYRTFIGDNTGTRPSLLDSKNWVERELGVFTDLGGRSQ